MRAARVVGVEADAVLARPADQAVVIGERLHRRMRHRCAGAEQKEPGLADRDGKDSFLRLERQRRSLLVEPSVLEVEMAPAIREPGQDVEILHGYTLARLRRPNPKALPGPMPWTTVCWKRAGSVILRIPS